VIILFLTCYAFFSDDPEYQKAFAALEELDLCSLKSVFKEKRFRVLEFLLVYNAQITRTSGKPNSIVTGAARET